jgi:hypothetical protein
MMDSVYVPACIRCGPVRGMVVETNVWISRGSTSSLLHKDSLNTINCQVQGTKRWYLVSPSDIGRVPWALEDEPPENASAGFSLLDPRAVDLVKWPEFATVPLHKAILEQGDCIYIPGSKWRLCVIDVWMDLCNDGVFVCADPESAALEVICIRWIRMETQMWLQRYCSQDPRPGPKIRGSWTGMRRGRAGTVRPPDRSHSPSCAC